MAKSGPKPKQPNEETTEDAPEAEGTTQSGTISGYFRKIFAENPSLLNERSNEELLRRWLADHPDETVVSERVKQNLANIKSVLRKKLRETAQTPGKKLGRPAKTAVAPPEKPVVRKASRELELLEEQIDDCLSAAKHLDREGLASVISHLRRARNDVVWRLASKPDVSWCQLGGR